MGRVVNKLAGVPLSYSGVSIVGRTTECLTSDSGDFQLDLDAGTVRMRIRHAGARGHHRVVGVFDAESGDPLQGAAVRDAASGKAAVTTATGTVNLGFVPRSSAVILIEHVGYERGASLEWHVGRS